MGAPGCKNEVDYIVDITTNNCSYNQMSTQPIRESSRFFKIIGFDTVNELALVEEQLASERFYTPSV